jgi:hypothetical protein
MPSPRRPPRARGPSSTGDHGNWFDTGTNHFSRKCIRRIPSKLDRMLPRRPTRCRPRRLGLAGCRVLSRPPGSLAARRRARMPRGRIAGLPRGEGALPLPTRTQRDLDVTRAGRWHGPTGSPSATSRNTGRGALDAMPTASSSARWFPAIPRSTGPEPGVVGLGPTGRPTSAATRSCTCSTTKASTDRRTSGTPAPGRASPSIKPLHASRSALTPCLAASTATLPSDRFG